MLPTDPGRRWADRIHTAPQERGGAVAPHEAALTYAVQQEVAQQRYRRDKDRDEKIERLSRNEVTGLEGKTRCFDKLNMALHSAAQRGGKVGLALIDLEQFNAVNEYFTHDGGDRILRAVAAWLRETSRHSDTSSEGKPRPKDQVFHISGDEFAIILGDWKLEDPEELRKLANKDEESIQEVMQKEMKAMRQEDPAVSQDEIYTGATIAIGVSDGKQSTEDFYRETDKLLFRRKQEKEQEIDEYNRRATQVQTQQGFIALVVVLILAVVLTISLVFWRVLGSQ